MSNKTPVVVESPIIPAIAPHNLYNCQANRQTSNDSPAAGYCSIDENSSCRGALSTSSKFAAGTSHSSLNNYVIDSPYHSFNGKDLALSFDRLQLSFGVPEEQDNCSASSKVFHKNKRKIKKYSSALTLKAVKHVPLKKASPSKTKKAVTNSKQVGGSSGQIPRTKFALKPSKLTQCVRAAFSRSYTDFHANTRTKTNQQRTVVKSDKDLSIYNEFSAACSKELDTIKLEGLSSDTPLRPRSSSLPASPQSTASGTTSSDSESKNEVTQQQSSMRRSRRKHASKAEQKGVTSAATEFRATNRANKRRKSPPGIESLEINRHVSNGGNERENQDTLDASIDRLADYLEDSILLPKKMSFMAEMMYT